MRITYPLTRFAAFVSVVCPIATARAVSTVTVYAWPLTAPSPTPFAKVSIDSQYSAKLESVTLPKPAADGIVRVGLYDTSSKSWTGVAASAAAFEEDARKKLTLHVDNDGRVYYVGYGTIPRKEDVSGKKQQTKRKRNKPKSQKALEREERERQRELKRKKKKGLPVEEEEEPFVVEVIRKQDGPRPILNKPVILNAEGKVDGQPDADNRTFLQKYWWVLVMFLLVQVLAGGGKE